MSTKIGIVLSIFFISTLMNGCTVERQQEFFRQVMIRRVDSIQPQNEPRLAFSAAFEGGNTDIYTIRPDGSALVTVTEEPSYKWSPLWSIDGESISFLSNRDKIINLYVVDKDGGAIRQVTYEMNIRYYVVSPKDNTFLFVSHDRGEYGIYIIDFYGNDLKLLAKTGDTLPFPSWSPDGNRIAFVDSNEHGSGIFVMDVDSKNRKTVVAEQRSLNAMPLWSPSGDKIAFVSATKGNPNSHIYLVNPDGTKLIQLTKNPGKDALTLGAWSPDGNFIAYAFKRNDFTSIYVVDVKTGEEIQLNQHSTDNSSLATWSPDGKQIVFTRAGLDLYFIYIKEVSEGFGTGDGDLITIGHQAVWSPLVK